MKFRPIIENLEDRNLLADIVVPPYGQPSIPGSESYWPAPSPYELMSDPGQLANEIQAGEDANFIGPPVPDFEHSAQSDPSFGGIMVEQFPAQDIP